jgi:PAS domain S-box-containing protein
MNYAHKTKEELVTELLRLEQENNFLKNANQPHNANYGVKGYALSEIEVYYRNLMENSPDAICIYSEGKIVQVNKSCIVLLAAKTADELIGKSVLEFVHPQGRDMIIERMKRTATENIILPLAEEKLVRLDGSVVDVEVKAIPVRFHHKPAFQLIILDISERKRVLAALRESEEKYRLIFENSPLGLLSFDDKGVIVACNEMFAQIIGTPIQKLVGLDMKQLPDKKLVSEINKTIDGGTGFYEDVYQSFTSNKTTPIIVFFAPMNIGNGILHGGVGIIKDITERVQAEEDLIERKEKYRGLSEAAFESIFFSEKGICIEQNQTAQNTFGYTNEEAIGRYGTEWIVPEDREMVMNKMLTGDENPYKSTALRKDGTTFPCMLRSKMMHYKGRDVRVTSLTDITDLKQAETLASEKEHLINSIAENSPNLIYIYHVEKGQNIYTNRSISKLLGYNEDEINDNDPDFFKKLMHPDDIRQFDVFYKDVNTWPKNKVFDFEYRILSKSGEWVWFKGREKEFERVNGQMVSLIGTVEDVTTKKKAEVALKESEAKYRALVENGFEGILIIDFEGNVLFANPALLQIFKYADFEQVKGKSVFLFLAPESIPVAIEDLTKVIQGMPMEVAQYKGVTANGTKIIIESLGKLIDFEGSQADIISVRDITTKKAIETALLESEEKYRLIAENTFDGIIVFDAQNHIQYTSPSYRKLFGYSESEEFGRDPDSIYSIIHPDERDALFAEIYKAIGDKKHALTYSYRALNKQGQYVWREDNAKFRYDGAGNYLGCNVVCRDIAERKKAESLLRESEEKYRLIAENTQDTITVLDMDLTITYISPSIKKLTNLSEDEVVFQKIDKILTPESLNKVITLFHEILPAEMDGTALQQSYPPIELQEFHQDGSELWLELSFAFTKNAENKPTGIVTVARDITTRKNIEQELIAAKEKAQESDRLKTAFLNGVSHEIRTPLNGILGFASLLKEADLTGDLKNEFILSIEKSGDRMLETITNIIDTALIHTGQMAIAKSEVNINKLMKQMLGRFEHEAKEKGLSLTGNFMADPEELLVITDDAKLNFILNHLINNAVKFTDSGHIEFGYTLKKPQGDKTTESVFLEFFIKDTGIGIAPERQAAIFAPFEHADIENIRAFQGVGLGLSVSKSFIEMLGGKIWLKSKVGIGSEFYFTLPA